MSKILPSLSNLQLPGILSSCFYFVYFCSPVYPRKWENDVECCGSGCYYLCKPVIRWLLIYGNPLVQRYIPNYLYIHDKEFCTVEGWDGEAWTYNIRRSPWFQSMFTHFVFSACCGITRCY
jgi:hypothetical protein